MCVIPSVQGLRCNLAMTKLHRLTKLHQTWRQTVFKKNFPSKHEKKKKPQCKQLP